MTGQLWNPRPTINSDTKAKKKSKKSKNSKNKPKDDSKVNAGEKAATPASDEPATASEMNDEAAKQVTPTEAEAESANSNVDNVS